MVEPQRCTAKPRMELRLLRASGLRESSVLCVKVGSRQSFVPYESIQRGVFKLPDTGETQHVHVELFELVGHAHFSVESHETSFDVPLMPVQEDERVQAEAALENAMSVALQLSAVSGMPEFEELSPPKMWPVGPVSAVRQHQAAISASKVQPYMEQHNLFNVLQELLHAVLKEKPLDPLQFMIKVLRGGSVASRTARPQHAHEAERPCWKPTPGDRARSNSPNPPTRPQQARRPQSATFATGTTRTPVEPQPAQPAEEGAGFVCRKPLEPLPILSPLQGHADTGALSTMSSSRHQHRSLVPGERRMLALPSTKSPKRPRDHAANVPLGSTLPSPQWSSTENGQPRAAVEPDVDPLSDVGLAPLAPIGFAATSRATGSISSRCNSMPSLAKPVLTPLRHGPPLGTSSSSKGTHSPAAPIEELGSKHAPPASQPVGVATKSVPLHGVEALAGPAFRPATAAASPAHAPDRKELQQRAAAALIRAAKDGGLARAFSALDKATASVQGANAPANKSEGVHAPKEHSATVSSSPAQRMHEPHQASSAQQVSPRPPMPTMWTVAPAGQGSGPAAATAAGAPDPMPPMPAFVGLRLQAAAKQQDEASSHAGAMKLSHDVDAEASTELPSQSLSPAMLGDSTAIGLDLSSETRISDKDLETSIPIESPSAAAVAMPLNLAGPAQMKATPMSQVPALQTSLVPAKPLPDRDIGDERTPRGQTRPCKHPEEQTNPACRMCWHPGYRRVRGCESSVLRESALEVPGSGATTLHSPTSCSGLQAPLRS